MNRKIKKLVAMGILAVMCVISVPVSVDASEVIRDDWTTNYITPTTISNDVTEVMVNPAGLYTGVCNYSNSSYDSLRITGYVSSDSGATYRTTINTTLSPFRAAGDVQTFHATTNDLIYARFRHTISCTSGTAVNNGYVYWIAD